MNVEYQVIKDLNDSINSLRKEVVGQISENTKKIDSVESRLDSLSGKLTVIGGALTTVSASAIAFLWRKVTGE